MENNSEIRPFTIDIPQADLDDLRVARQDSVGCGPARCRLEPRCR